MAVVTPFIKIKSASGSESLITQVSSASIKIGDVIYEPVPTLLDDQMGISLKDFARHFEPSLDLVYNGGSVIVVCMGSTNTGKSTFLMGGSDMSDSVTGLVNRSVRAIMNLKDTALNCCTENITLEAMEVKLNIICWFIETFILLI